MGREGEWREEVLEVFVGRTFETSLVGGLVKKEEKEGRRERGEGKKREIK
jgi:hypothetical protein